MSPTAPSARVATPAASGARTDLDPPGEGGHREHASLPRWLRPDVIGLAAAVVAALITYGFYLAHPWPVAPMDQLLAMLARSNAAVWPMHRAWYASAAAIVVRAPWPQSPRWPDRRRTLVICLLTAAYLAWSVIAFFGVLNRGMNFAWFWAAVVALEGMLFAVAGALRHDLAVAPRWDRGDVASVLGAVFIACALIAYPIIGMLAGHALAALPAFGLAPCPTVVFALGLLLWAQRPVPLYLLPVLLAWCFGAARKLLTWARADFTSSQPFDVAKTTTLATWPCHSRENLNCSFLLFPCSARRHASHRRPVFPGKRSSRSAGRVASSRVSGHLCPLARGALMVKKADVTDGPLARYYQCMIERQRLTGPVPYLPFALRLPSAPSTDH